jgi:hypothetical protein
MLSAILFFVLLQSLGVNEVSVRNLSSEKFIGCVWSPSECRWSCAGYDYFRAEYRPEFCELYFNSNWACYCENDESNALP